MHCVKNRALLRIKNATRGVLYRHWPAILLRDIVVLLGCVLFETSSLKAFPMVFRRLGHTLKKREEIMRRREVGEDYLANWFCSEPKSYPARNIPAKAIAMERAASS
jgi:hypothetical protein